MEQVGLVAERHAEDRGFRFTGRTNIEGCFGAQQDVSALQNCHDIVRGLLFQYQALSSIFKNSLWET